MYRKFKSLPQRLTPVLFLTILLPTICSGYLSRQEAFNQSFDLVWSTVQESYWDESFGGLDWEGIRDQYRPQLDKVKSRADLAHLLQRMLNELELSHFRIMSSSGGPSDSFPRGGFVGLDLKYHDGRAYVVRVIPGSPAADAGIQVGWRLKAIHGKSVKRLSAPYLNRGLSEKSEAFYIEHYLNEVVQGGTRRRIRTDWYPPGKRALKVYMDPVADTRDLSDAVGYLPSQRIEYEQKYLDGNILYLRFNWFVPNMMVDIRETIETAEGRASGMILDLRSNLGGLSIMATGITGLLVDVPTNLGKLNMKKGYLTYQGYPQTRRFRGPVAILVDKSSASTSEILAAGLQEAGRARVFGEISLGESLPSIFKKLPSGDVLQYAVGDYHTPGGYRIEKNGVVPNVIIEPEFKALEAGSDLPLEEAAVWILKQSESNGDEA
jgi:carboxyl-terminal processing protease